MAFPKNPVDGQTYETGGYIYQYSSTKYTWTKIGQSTTTISNVTIANGNVSTGNTSITSNTITTGNTSITSNTISTGNTTITSNSVTTGNTTVSDTGIVAGNTSITDNSITTGNTSITSNSITTGNTSLTETGLTTGNTVITSNTIATGNTSITDTGLTTGNTSITSNSITTGNTTLTSNAVSTGNTTLSETGLTTGNTTITSNTISTGNTVITSNAITTGNTSITSNTVSVGNTTVTETQVVTETVSANTFSGNGYSLTSINSANITGIVANANYASYAGNITISSQPNITSVGTLENLTVSGNATIAGNFTVSGNTSYINVTTLDVKDPIIQLGGGSNGSPLTSNDGKDRGTLLNYYVDSPVSAFMGWDNSNAEFLFASNVQVSSDIIAVNQLANIRADYIYGNFVGNISGNIVLPGGNTEIIFNENDAPAASPNLRFDASNSLFTVDGIANITTVNANVVTASNVVANTFTGTLIGSATTATTVTASSQPNITSLGQLTSLVVTGNASANNISAVNSLSATTIEGTLITSAQPSITSVGTLDNLIVSGNITSTNADLGNTVVANYFVGNGYYISYVNGSNVSEVPYANFAAYAGYANITASAEVANTVSENAQPNITSVGTLTSLTVAGMLTSFNAVMGNTVSANFFAGDGYQLGNITAANIIGEVSNANYASYSNVSNFTNTAGTVTENAQPNITSVGTLSSLTVTGNIAAGNANLGNVATANYFIGDGGFLSNIATGAIANYANYAGNAVIADSANIALTVTENAQPNITSVGVLDELTISGNLYAGNIDGGNIVTANYLAGDGSLIANLTGSAVTGWVPQSAYANNSGNSNYSNTSGNAGYASSANIANTVLSSSQPNITSVGTLTSLDITGNLTANNALFGNNVAALNFIGDGSNLSNISGANIVGEVPNANVSEYSNIANTATSAITSNTVIDNAQPNITSLGTLTGLSVSGTTTLNNVSANGIAVGNVTITVANVTANNFIGNFSGPGINTGVVFNDSGFMNTSNAFQFDPAANTANLAGVLNVADSITRDGKEVPTYTTSGTVPINPMPGDEWYDELNDRIYKYIYDGLSYAWIDVTSGFISANVSATANTMALRDANGNIYANTFNGTTLIVSGESDLGNASNVTITGGNSGYVLTTDGTGNLTWSNPASQGVSGGNTEVQFNNNGTFGSDANFTYGYSSGILSAPLISSVISNAASSQPNITTVGNLLSLDVIGNIVGNTVNSESGYLYLGNGVIVVEGANAGVLATHVTNLNLGLAANVFVGSTAGNTTIRGNLVANANVYVADTATITNLKVNDFYSNRTPISVTNGTIVDSFPVNKYRSAKYTMRVNSDDGYQAVEVLLIHDGVNSYVTIYGSLSTIGTDIITLSTAINSGNVELLATSESGNTTVNLLGTYVAD